MEGHPTRTRRLTRAIVYGVAVAVPIGLLAFLVRTQFDPLVDLDQSVILAATDFTRSHPRFRSVAETWELISQPWVMYLVLGVPLCLFAWFRLNLRTRAMWALATMAVGWAVAGPVTATIADAAAVAAVSAMTTGVRDFTPTPLPPGGLTGGPQPSVDGRSHRGDLR